MFICHGFEMISIERNKHICSSGGMRIMGLQLRVVVAGVQLGEWMKYLVDCWSLTGAVQGMCCCCGWCLCVEDHGVI